MTSSYDTSRSTTSTSTAKVVRVLQLQFTNMGACCMSYQSSFNSVLQPTLDHSPLKQKMDYIATQLSKCLAVSMMQIFRSQKSKTDIQNLSTK